MQVMGNVLIGGEWVEGDAESFRAVNPATGEPIEPAIRGASADQARRAVETASAAATEFRLSSLADRARFLTTCAEEIMALGDTLVERAVTETGLPAARIEGERARTCGQLQLFADVVRAGDFLDVRIDTAQPDRKPQPRPDLRYMKQAVGPVSVFGASNFPLAFSVAGGDTASALAAGCPVLVKGHPSHPGTGELVARALDAAVKKTGMPAGVFSLLNGTDAEVGAALVVAPEIRAVGFTGSFRGGMALTKLAAERPDPILVFAEMGSLNPVLLLPNALESDAESIAEKFVASLTLGVGQFCTNPGLVLGIASSALDRFIASASMILAQHPGGVMLNEGIQRSYREVVERVSAQRGVKSTAGAGTEQQSGFYRKRGATKNAVGGGALSGARTGTGSGTEQPGFHENPALLTVSAAEFIANPRLSEEMFGPAALVIRCGSRDELYRAVTSLRGQLTGTIHGETDEIAEFADLVDLLSERAGRVLINGFPTGVEVCHAMSHGGPFPATTDVRFTSVGTAAIDRFLRPVCLQNFPPELLPDALRDGNPLNIRRLVDGKWTSSAIEQ